MNVSYIINTAAGDKALTGSNQWRSLPYSERARLLSEEVIPSALAEGFHEVIVAGTWHDGEGYKYVPVQPMFRDRRDALWQREIGARHATGDVLVFGHDDHKVAAGFRATLRHNYLADVTGPTPEWDLIVPQRLHGITNAVLNNGADKSYMGGHILVMKRWLWAECPWTAVDTVYWDTSMSRIWREAGARIIFSDLLQHVDVEATEDES